jgi:hypothetical protein
MRHGQLTRWIGSMAAISVGLVWLHFLGAGDLGAPPLSLDGAASWLEHRDTTIAAFALLRLVALVFGWYLLLITAIGGAARALRLRRITSVVDRFTFPFARGVLGGMALLGVTTAPPPVQPPTPDSMIELSTDADQATLRLLPDTSTAPTPEPQPAPAAPSADADVWVVQRGESFWSIAAEHLADVNGRPVNEREVGSYWRRVVELNRSRLVNPDDADLLFTGQEIELPAVAPG